MSQNQGFDLGSLLGGLLGGNKNAAAPGAPAAAGGSGGGGLSGMLGGLLSGGMLSKLMPMLTALVAGGGLQKLMGQLQGGGLGQQAKSWVSADQPNQPITGEQLTQALGPDTISQFATTTGMSQEAAAKAMAEALPGMVNAMTPQGEVPEHVETPDASTMQAHINSLLGSAQQEAGQPGKQAGKQA